MIDGLLKENIIKMKQIVYFLAFLFSLTSFSQVNEIDPDEAKENDINTLSIFSEYYKSKNFEAAYEPWMELRKRSPKFNNAIYVYGEKILKYKIENSTSNETKKLYVLDKIDLYNEYLLNFPLKTKKGDIFGKIAKLKYDYRDILSLSLEDIYNDFEKAYSQDLKTFNNPLHLYTYFKLKVALYDMNLRTPSELFSKYDDILEKVESETKNYTKLVNTFLSKSENGTPLSSKEERKLKSYSSFLKAYDQISKGMAKDIGDRGNCENLIPLYSDGFDSNKDNIQWLDRAMKRLFDKECDDSQLYVKIVEQKANIEPDAKTYFYLGYIKSKEGKTNEAIENYLKSIDLEDDNYEKSKICFMIAQDFRKKGSYSKARSYYNQALKYNPSMGKAYLAIASMYAKSAKRCGDGNFNQRAVFWLAASEASKAGRVDPTLKKSASKASKSYFSNAPSKSEIFSSGRSGETIRIGCWIGRSVKVPSL